MTVPSIKGTIFQGVIDDLARLRGEGRVSDAQIETGLIPEDLVYLENEINASGWYPLESYTRFSEFLCQIEGEGKDSYYVERGHRSARRLVDGGLYQQLAFLERWTESSKRGDSEESLIANYARNLKLVVSMAASIYNSNQWVVEPDTACPGRFRIAIRNACHFSDPMRLAAEGFLNECTATARPDILDLFRSERAGEDLIYIRMTRDVMSLY